MPTADDVEIISPKHLRYWQQSKGVRKDYRDGKLTLVQRNVQLGLIKQRLRG